MLNSIMYENDIPSSLPYVFQENSKAEFDQEQYIQGFSLSNVKFTERTVEQLISVVKHMHGTS